MKQQYTYEEIYKVLKSKDYNINNDLNIPLFNTKSRSTRTTETNNRKLINFTPELAQQLIEHDGKLAKKKQIDNTPILVDKDTQEILWSPDMGEIQLRSNFKVWKGMNILEAIVNQKQNIDVYVNIIDDTKLSGDKDNKYICNEIKNSVKATFEENGLEFPELDETIWESSLSEKLKDFDIAIKEKEENTTNDEISIILVILANLRDNDFPDKIFIMRGNNESGVAKEYICNMIPSITQDRPLTLMPGIYDDLLAPAFDFDGLIQASGVSIYSPKIINNKIDSYEETIYQFMRISFPVQEPKNGIIPLGAKFYNENTKNEFVNELKIESINKKITLIILEESDFEE